MYFFCDLFILVLMDWSNPNFFLPPSFLIFAPFLSRLKKKKKNICYWNIAIVNREENWRKIEGNWNGEELGETAGEQGSGGGNFFFSNPSVCSDDVFVSGETVVFLIDGFFFWLCGWEENTWDPNTKLKKGGEVVAKRRNRGWSSAVRGNVACGLVVLCASAYGMMVKEKDRTLTQEEEWRWRLRCRKREWRCQRWPGGGDANMGAMQ